RTHRSRSRTPHPSNPVPGVPTLGRRRSPSHPTAPSPTAYLDATRYISADRCGRGGCDKMHAVSGPAVPSDYDDNPQRFLAWQPAEDVHESVAERVAREGLLPVLRLGCGAGRRARGEQQPSATG